MRKNTLRAMRAFDDRRPGHPAEAIWTDGRTIFSYATALLTTSPCGYILNTTKYSPTTSIHQSALVQNYPGALWVNGLPMGATRQDLLDAAGSNERDS